MTRKFKPALFCVFAILSAALLPILGCRYAGENKSQIVPNDTAKGDYYPRDHKLTAEERKEYSIKILRRKGVPVLESLPRIDDYTNATFRSQFDVANKAVELYGLVYVANGAKTSQEMITYFKKYNLWRYVSPNERAYLNKTNRTAKDDNPVAWRIENLNVLLWALENFDTLPFPTTPCDFSHYKDLPNLDADPTAWINHSKLRSTEEILNETDLIYRIHWATVDANLKSKPVPAGINEDVVMERHYALNWLTMYDENWDDITTDT